MLAQSPPSLAYESCKQSFQFSWERSGFKHHFVLYVLLPRLESLHKCPHARVDISHFRETFLHHICRGSIPKTVPKHCANRAKYLTDWIVRTEDYPAAYGGFSDIWSCQLRLPQLSDRRVAVKTIRPMFANDEELQAKRRAVDKELNVWVQLEHVNILPLYGIASGFGPFPAFVCPWAGNGTLSEYLERFETQLDLKKRMELLRDIAAGVGYLHHNKIVHGDLSSTNVLVTDSGIARISDFGLSTALDTGSMSGTSSFPGNIRWAAPELFDEDKPASQLASPRADIYSFGSLMLEILSGKLPFHRIQRVAQIVIMVSKGTRPPREPAWNGSDIPDALWEFMETCWSSPPAKRPKSRDVDRFIKRQLSRL